MKISKVIEFLYTFKAWKKGKIDKGPDPEDMIKAVGTAIAELKSWQIAKVKIQKKAENADKPTQKE